MDKKEKKIKEIKHRLFLFLALAGVAALMLLYVWFVGKYFGDFGTKSDMLNAVENFAASYKTDIKILSENEIAAYDKSSAQPRTIEKTGELQPARDNIFAKVQSGEVYVSDATGNVCAKYDVSLSGENFVIIYDSGNANAHANGQFSDVIDDSITVAMVGNEIM